MQPEVTGALIAAIGALVVSLINVRSARDAKVLVLEVKNQLLQFENTFVDRLNGRYIRKPDQPEDYPMSKAEGRSIEKKVDSAASLFEQYRKDVHERFDELHREINLRKS